MNKKTFSVIVNISVFVIALSVAAWSKDMNFFVQGSAGEKSEALPGLYQAGVPYISLAHLCATLGIDWQWERMTEQLVMVHDQKKVVVTNDNPFYLLQDSIIQLFYPPFRSTGNLYLRVEDATTIMSFLKGHTIGVEEQPVESGPIKMKTNEAPPPEMKMNPIDTKDSTTQENIVHTKKGVKKEAQKKKSPSMPVGKATTQRDARQHIKTVVIDPGHGGKDPGAVGPSGLKEKDVVLAIALSLRDALQKNTDLKIVMTRETDVFIPLSERTKFANAKHADLFLSIHANSIAGDKNRKNSIKGYKIYFLSQAKNEEDKLAAMIENSVIELEEEKGKGDYLQNILIDMANNEFLTESQDIAIILAETLGKSLDEVSALQKGVGQANFWVLNGSYMPSVLVETCFISNPAEEKLLAMEKFQKKMGTALADAIIHFKKKYEADL